PREDHLTHFDRAAAEAALAIGEVIFPHAAEALVETERFELWPGGEKTFAPLGKRCRIILAEGPFVQHRHAVFLAEVAHDGGGGEHAAGENIPADEIDLAAVARPKPFGDGDDLQPCRAAGPQPLAHLAEEARPEAFAHSLEHLDRDDAVENAALVAVVA